MQVDNFLGSSDFLKAADLGTATPTLTVKSVSSHEFNDDGGSRQKLVLEFIGKDKMVVLNVTNTRAMAAAFGNESDNWIGKQVLLSVRQTQMGPGIGVTPMQAPQHPNPIVAQQQRAAELNLQQQQQAAASGDALIPLDDDIPF